MSLLCALGVFARNLFSWLLPQISLQIVGAIAVGESRLAGDPPYPHEIASDCSMVVIPSARPTEICERN